MLHFIIEPVKEEYDMNVKAKPTGHGQSRQSTSERCTVDRTQIHDAFLDEQVTWVGGLMTKPQMCCIIDEYNIVISFFFFCHVVKAAGVCC